MYFPDLSPCTYFPVPADGKLVAVGWLEPGHDFPRGEVSDGFVAKLVALLADPWQPAVAAGRHPCGFCRLTGGPAGFRLGNRADQPEVRVGAANVFVPGDGVLYAAPSLILHYLDAHGYAPPGEFQRAVLGCPPMRSMDYLRAVVRNGPKGLVGRGTTGHESG